MFDDPLTEDFHELLGPDYDSLPSDEQYRQVKDAVAFEQFAPTQTPATLDSDCYNPAIEGYLDAGLSWGDEGWEPVDETDVLRVYPEYVPTDTAIETLCEYGPLLEVGAGNGYWAHTVNENGGNCLPTDLSPEAVSTTEFPATVTYDGTEYETKVWADVREYDGVAAVQDYPDRTVVMCHPSGATRWSEDVLAAITDQPFIFIGEWFPGADATPMFFKRLADDWELVETFPVYDWASMHVRGYVFEQ